MQWPCESVSFVVLIESEAAVCGLISVCLSLCGWGGVRMSGCRFCAEALHSSPVSWGRNDEREEEMEKRKRW